MKTLLHAKSARYNLLYSSIVISSLIAPGMSLAQTTTTIYEYDDLGQLKSAERSDNKDHYYTYDQSGNRLSRTDIVNTAPVANNDSGSTTYPMVTYINLTNNDTDANSHSLRITSVTQPSNGSVFIDSASTVSFAPSYSVAFPTYGSFTYTITDGYGGEDSATVNVTANGSGGGCPFFC